MSVRGFDFATGVHEGLRRQGSSLSLDVYNQELTCTQQSADTLGPPSAARQHSAVQVMASPSPIARQSSFVSGFTATPFTNQMPPMMRKVSAIDAAVASSNEMPGLQRLGSVSGSMSGGPPALQRRMSMASAAGVSNYEAMMDPVAVTTEERKRKMSMFYNNLLQEAQATPIVWKISPQHDPMQRLPRSHKYKEKLHLLTAKEVEHKRRESVDEDADLLWLKFKGKRQLDNGDPPRHEVCLSALLMLDDTICLSCRPFMPFLSVGLVCRFCRVCLVCLVPRLSYQLCRSCFPFS
jgi:hypothetical protein